MFWMNDRKKYLVISESVYLLEWKVVVHEFFKTFCETPLSLYKWVCLSRLQPLSVCVCVNDSRCLSEAQ